MITVDQLRAIMPRLSSELAEKYLPSLKVAMAQYEINSTLRVAAFLAQLAHESSELTRLEENLNYSSTRLRQVFPKYFPTQDLADQYAHKPQAVANRVYGNRLGNGDEGSGEGYRYRGRGFIQLTGKGNYTSASKALGVDLVANPDLAASPATAFMIAAWFWKSRDLNQAADKRAFNTITRVINGGVNGLEDRLRYYAKALKVLGEIA